MIRFWSGLALVVAVLVLGGNINAFDDDDDKEIKAAKKDVLDLAKKIEDGGKPADVAAEAGKIKKKYEELNTVMHGYKPPTKGGIGFGKGKGAGDGIELKIIDLGKRKLAAAALAKQKDDLVKMGYINLAMAEIAAHYSPAKPKGGKGAKEWKQYLDDMKKSSMALIKEVKAAKPDAEKIKAAANDLGTSCKSCHSDFRDNP